MGAIPVPLAVMGSPKCWQVETLMYFGGGFVLRSARSWYGLDVTYSPSFYLTLSGLVWRSAEQLPTSSMPYSPAPAGFPPTEWGRHDGKSFWPICHQFSSVSFFWSGLWPAWWCWPLGPTVQPKNRSNMFGHFLWWASLFQSCACYLVTR